ncbi:hypothetical protein BGZ81_007082 [Podila clonocystis]|nr:hypothetical protein BGZ81_007082 [Podila clonocystis]
MGPRWLPSDPRLPPPYENDRHLDRIIQHINFLFGFIPGVSNSHSRFDVMERLETIRRAMDLDGQRYQEINSECHHLRSEMERLRTDRYRAEEARDRAEEERDRFRADNKFYRDDNCRLTSYNEKMLSDYNKLEQRYKSLEARQGLEHLSMEITHAEKARASFPEESMTVSSLLGRLDAAQESNTPLRNELLSSLLFLSMTTAKDTSAAHLRLFEGMVGSLANELGQVKPEMDKRTNDSHGNKGQRLMVSSEELSRVKEDLQQARFDIATKENENSDLSTQLHLMEQSTQQQEEKILQLSRELEQNKTKEIHQRGSVQHKDDQGKIYSLENKVQTLQSQLDHTSQALRDSNEVIKVMTEKQERSANPTQVIQSLEQLKADLERKQSQARQVRIVSMKAMLEYKEQFGYKPSEEESEMKIKELEAALEEMRKNYERVTSHLHVYPAHERALVEAAASISQWRRDVESRMSTSIYGRDSRAAR